MRGDEFWPDKRVLVLGHTGFKGSWLSLWLHKKGARVFGFSLPVDDQRCLFAAAELSTIVDTTYGDIRELTAVRDAFAQVQPQIVFHLAAQSLVRQSYREPVATYATNVMGTVHLLAAAAETPSVRSVIVVTSDKCYENREWLWAYREDEPLGGYDPYSSSKACAEIVTKAWRRSFCGADSGRTIGIASARAGNVIGGGDWAEDRLVPDCMRALLAGLPIGIRNPQAVRPWQHLLDPLAGYLLLAQRLWDDAKVYSEAWNFGPADEDIRSVGWIASYIAKRWGQGACWEDVVGSSSHEATLLKVDASKARTRLGWSQRVRLVTGLDWTVDWYKAFARGEPARVLMTDQIARFDAMLNTRTSR